MQELKADEDRVEAFLSDWSYGKTFLMYNIL